MKNGKYEILAPAGSVEQLVAAVNNGCDSVYLGLESFNARMKAPNFNAENLGHWVDFCHFFGVKVYVTINTSLKNSEFSHAVQLLNISYKNNVDGVIVTDLALLKIAAKLPKPFDVVASTQLNTHDGFGAQFLKDLGADTVVCARECSFEDIEEIAKTGVCVESFLHGALCVCQSGQCLFSSMVGGNSGNRGLCAQPCRKLYKSNAGKYQNGGYLLSPKDLCGLDVAERLLKCGVSTFKIEGRNRRAEYAGVTSKVYSQLFANNFAYDEKDRLSLLEMYNRGDLPVCNYLLGRNDQIIFPSAQNHIGVVVGKIAKNKVQTAVQLTKGDGLKVFDGDREVCGGFVTQSGTGLVTADFSGKVRDGFVVRRTSSVQLCQEVLSAKRTVDLQGNFVAIAGESAKLTLRSGSTVVTVESDWTVEVAQKNPTTKEEIAQQLGKTGDFRYTISNIVVEIGNIFIPKSQLNGLRRSACEVLLQQIVADYNSKFANRQTVEAVCDNPNRTVQQANCLAVICKNTQEVAEVVEGADYVIYKPEIISAETLALPAFCYVDLPSFSDNSYLEKLLSGANLGIVCHNVGHVQLARKLNLRYIAGTGLNIFNDQMANVFDDADTFFYSQELSLAEISAFKNRSGLAFVDGVIALMKLVHCPFKAVFGGDCAHCMCNKKLTYTDEFGNEFVIKRRKDKRCTFELINGNKLSVVSKLKQGGRYCVDYNASVISHYINLNNGVVDCYNEQQNYTKGRLFNKIN